MSLFVTLGRSQLSTNNVLLSRALAPQCLSTKIQECQGGGRCAIRTYVGNNVVCSDRATCVYRGGVSVEEEGSTKQEVEKEVPSTFLLQPPTITPTMFHFGRAVCIDEYLPHRHTEHFLPPTGSPSL